MSETIINPLSEEQTARYAALSGARELLGGGFASAPNPDDLMDLADYIIGGGDEEDFDPFEGTDYPGEYDDEPLELIEPPRFRVTEEGSHGFEVGAIVTRVEGVAPHPFADQLLMTTRHDEAADLSRDDWQLGVTAWVRPEEMVEVDPTEAVSDDKPAPMFAVGDVLRVKRDTPLGNSVAGRIFTVTDVEQAPDSWSAEEYGPFYYMSDWRPSGVWQNFLERVPEYLAHDDIEGPVVALDAEGLEALPAGTIIQEHSGYGSGWMAVRLGSGEWFSLYAKVRYGDESLWATEELACDAAYVVLHLGTAD